ncbi:MAG: bifunctional riboflavin kinase/FAD synthetase [Clostridiales Family XIII bacterium]|jgi:riboflavin kinase/FMN adenylyltransferase|nr:bifunctional riboflavin kinase/FAD synthetase [Clostridiales Family XIII bacterium]
MIIFNNLEEIDNIGKTALAMGNFDGLHLGHRRLLELASDGAKEKGLKSAVFTFSNHPKSVIEGVSIIKNIMRTGDKAEAIAAMGIDYLFSIPFDKSIQFMQPLEFANKLLVQKFNAAHVYCGFNHHFGFRAGGDAEALVRFGKDLGFEVSVLRPEKVEDAVVSSSLIRRYISEGMMEECAMLLGRNYSVGGEVVVGNRIGRKLGFPTLNILMDDDMVLPPHGVYITNCYLGDHIYAGVTNVGVRPTVGDDKKSIETHVFDFNEELYGSIIKIEFLKKTRDEKKFASLDELAAQIDDDCRQAREYHSNGQNKYKPKSFNTISMT